MSILLFGQPSPVFPATPAEFRFVIEAAFGSGPNDDAYEWTTIHDSDTGGYVRSFGYQRGRNNQLAQIETGTGTLILNNLDGEWDPHNTASPFYPYVRPMLPFRARAVIDGVNYSMFVQYADGFPRKRIGPTYSEVVVSTVDGQEGLALARVTPDKATLTTAIPLDNNDFTFTAKQPGAAGNDITVAYFETHFRPLRQQRVVITVTGTNIRVDYLDDGSVQADEVLAALQADAATMILVDVENAPGSAGTGDMRPMAETHLAGGDTIDFPQEGGGARINRCLDLAEWPTNLRQISIGRDYHSELAFSTSEDGKILSHMQEISSVCSENGLLYLNGDGRVVFLDRADKLTEHSTPAAVLADLPEAGEFPYVDLVPNQGKDLIVNDAVCTRDGGDTQNAYDSDSVGLYRHRSRSFTTTLATDVDVAAAVQMAVVELKDPLERIEQVAVMPGADKDCWAAMLGLDIGSRVTVSERLPYNTGESLYGEGLYGAGFYGGSPSVPTDDDYIIQGLSWQFPPGPPTPAKVTFNLWPADPIHNWFILDDPVRGVLDAGNRIGR